MTVFESRRDKLRQLLAQKSLDALLVTEERNVTYLTGFTGDSSYLLVAAKRHGGVGELLLTDGRYTEQLETECPGLMLAVRQPGRQASRVRHRDAFETWPPHARHRGG